MKQNQKLCRKMKKVINTGKSRKTLSVVKLAKSLNKDHLQSFLEIRSVQKEVLTSHQQQDHAYEWQNPFGLKEDTPLTEKLPESIESSRFVSHRVGLSGEFYSRKDSQSTKFEQRPQIFVQQSLKDLCNSRLSGLHPSDNITIIH